MHAILEVRKLTPQERAVVEVLLRSRDAMPQRDLISRMRDAPSQATISRIMAGLIEKGLLIKEGETRGARYSLTADARRVAMDPRRRQIFPYDPDRIGTYVPNVTRWLQADAAARMARAVEDAGGQKLDASTYSKAIAERFLIDLSWASSNLEGNTYDHLSTEMLIRYGESASGRDRTETAMILNHKAAISRMIDRLGDAFPDVYEVQRRHVLMMRDLLDPGDLGVIRHRDVQVSATSYRPSSDSTMLSLGLSNLLTKASQINDPFEASFVLLVGTSYLQSFGDGNKRMGRLLSNEPLLRAGLPPLSFIGIDKTPYILGLIEFYEVGATALLGDAIAESYEATAADYVRSVAAQRVPHGLELRERSSISVVLGRIFRERIADDGIPKIVKEAFIRLDEDDRLQMVEIITKAARQASPASAFLFGVSEEDILRRNGR